MSIKDEQICIDCGLCCDGTMFHALDLDQSDDVDALRSLGAVMVTDSTSRRFQQPCPGFGDGCCTIYSSRPVVCRTYSCALLTSVDEGSTTPDDARRVIRRARELSGVLRQVFADDDGTAVHLGQHGLSSVLRVLHSRYQRQHLRPVFPEAVELIGLLRDRFGWATEETKDQPAPGK